MSSTNIQVYMTAGDQEAVERLKARYGGVSMAEAIRRAVRAANDAPEPPQARESIHHIDGEPANNSLDNIELVGGGE